MSRAASLLKADRDAERPRMSLELGGMAQVPENIANIVADGDAILTLSGMSTAPVQTKFMTLFTDSREEDGSVLPRFVLPAPQDDGDAMYILCNILHLRNDKLPTRMLPDLLCKVAILAHKYQCVIAARPATLQWFDRLYVDKGTPDTWTIFEAAYLLDEAIFFARFTTRWILDHTMCTRSLPTATSSETQVLANVLPGHHALAYLILRNDLDDLVDTCAPSFTKENKHFIDWAPGISPLSCDSLSDKPSGGCHVDSQGAMEYLGALREANIWPATVWSEPSDTTEGSQSIGDVVEKLRVWREPMYNDVDKCEFCDDIKSKFTEQLATLRNVQRERLWGLCLDCFKDGGIHGGDCRYEHAKPQDEQGQQSG